MPKEFDEDAYWSRKLDEHLAEQDDMEVSDCCGEPIDDESIDVCSKCKEHCNVVAESERNYDKEEEAMCDKADSDRDEALIND